jgi:hypothetical protein
MRISNKILSSSCKSLDTEKREGRGAEDLKSVCRDLKYSPSWMILNCKQSLTLKFNRGSLVDSKVVFGNTVLYLCATNEEYRVGIPILKEILLRVKRIE